MANNKNQHYVPQLYLRNFSDNGKQISLYLIPSNIFLKSKANIKDEASDKYFYGKDSFIDNQLQKIESQINRVIKNLVENNQLPIWDSFEHFLILQFVLTLHSRNPYMKEGHNKRYESSFKTFFSKHPAIDKGVKETLDLFEVTDKNASQISVSLSLHSLPLIFDLKFKLLDNKTDLAFWTSDNPSVLYNQFLEKKRPHFNNTGLITKGLQIFCPLSPAKYLIFYDGGTYKVGSKDSDVIEIKSLTDIEQLNKLQFMSAVEKLYFNNSFDESYLHSFNYRLQRDRDSKQFNFKCEILSESSNEIVQLKSMPEVRSNLSLSFTKVLKKAQAFQIGKRIYLPRSSDVLLLKKDLDVKFSEMLKENQI